MAQLSPVLLGISLSAALMCFLCHVLQFSSEVLYGTFPYHKLRLVEIAGCIWSAAVLSLLLLLMVDGLTFTADGLVLLRWSVLLGAALGIFTGLRSHDWLSMLSGIPFLFTVPFFESAFGELFSAVLPVMLLLSALDGLLRAIREFRSTRNLPGPDTPQEALEVLDAGLLFTEENGKILMKNRIMDGLSSSLCHCDLTNGIAFWNALESFEGTELVTKVSHEGTYLFRFAGGYTWSLFRDTIPVQDRLVTQYLALNVTEGDKIQRTTLLKRAEAVKLKKQAEAVETLDQQLQDAKARKEGLRQELKGLLEEIEKKSKKEK